MTTRTSAQSAEDLHRRLAAIDGRGYKAYQGIAGAYGVGPFTLFIDHVQSDPFAPPSRLRLRIDRRAAGIPDRYLAPGPARVATADFLSRLFAAAARRAAHRAGTGKSGLIYVDAGGQEILPRTSCLITEEFIEARVSVGLPAAGRRCLGREAAAILLQTLPAVGEAALRYDRLDQAALTRHVEVAEDQEALRRALRERGLVAFVADGSVLPRESGVSDRPLRGPRVVPFRSPAGLRVEIPTPHRGRVAGAGIPEGVTLLVGGGYHGKSTLLNALARCVYDHIPGDGREYVVTREDAMKVRAEDGRRVTAVDISPFISNLPFGQDTVRFTTDAASGSTSQAANIIEALELGSRLLLLDEDTSATNFMVRDARMQRLVPKDQEPITPFVDRVRELYQAHGVSVILVTGGNSDYFEVADTVLRMHEYEPELVTDQVRELIREMPSDRIREAPAPMAPVAGRVPASRSLEAERRGRERVSARGLQEIEWGEQTIDLWGVEQLVDTSQTRAVADLLRYARRRGYFDDRRTLREALEAAFRDVERQGLDVISPFRGHPGDLALPRLLEAGAAVNRLRSLQVR